MSMWNLVAGKASFPMTDHSGVNQHPRRMDSTAFFHLQRRRGLGAG